MDWFLKKNTLTVCVRLTIRTELYEDRYVNRRITLLDEMTIIILWNGGMVHELYITNQLKLFLPACIFSSLLVARISYWSSWNINFHQNLQSNRILRHLMHKKKVILFYDGRKGKWLWISERGRSNKTNCQIDSKFYSSKFLLKCLPTWESGERK